MSTTEIGIGGNREHKDTLFRKIFGYEKIKKWWNKERKRIANILLTREREEVFMTTLFEVDKEIYENDLRKEGELKGRKEIMFAMYQSGISVNQIAAIIKMDVEEVEKMIGNK